MNDAVPLIAEVIVALALAATGVSLIWMALAGRNGRLRRNPFVGIRTTLTLSSDTAWDVAHRSSASFTLTAGIGALACAALALVADSTGLLTTAAAVAAVWLLLWVAVGALIGIRAAKKVVADDPDAGITASHP